MKFLPVLFLLTILFSSCGGGKKKGEFVIPEEIIYASASTSDPEQTSKRMDALTAYLTKELGIPVKFVKVTDYSGVIEGMKYNKVHIASTGSLAYCLAEQRADAKAIVTVNLGDGEMRRYQSMIITHPGSNIDTITDILENPGKYTFAFTDPASTSGHLMPRAFLESHGLVPEEDFKEVLFSGSHTASIYSLVAQKVDATASFRNALDRVQMAGRLDASQYKVLWESKPIPSSPVFVKSDLHPDITAKIIDAYVHMKERSPETYKLYQNVYQAVDVSFSKSDPKDWDEIRDIIKGLKSM